MLTPAEKKFRNNGSDNDCFDLRMVEFFSGIGGMRLAVENAVKKKHNKRQQRQQQQQCASDNPDSSGAFVILSHCQAYEISLHAINCYKHNFEQNDDDDDAGSATTTSSSSSGSLSFSSGSCTTKLVEQLKAADLEAIRANLWTLSPPCQPFTSNPLNAKVRDMDDKRCNGLKAIIGLLDQIDAKPTHILLENVKGFHRSRMVEAWYACLKRNGYTWKSVLTSPVQYGIPNHRQRLYILCERSDRWKPTILKRREDQNDGLSSDLCSTTPTTIASSKQQQQQQQQQRPIQSVSSFIDQSLTSCCGNNAAAGVSENPNLAPFMIPEQILEQEWARGLGIVTAADTATHCFTAGYGRILHKATGSLLLMPQAPPLSPNCNSNEDEECSIMTSPVKEELPAVAAQPLDRSNMLQYAGRLRRFTPKELLRLFGFPSSYNFPKETNLENQYKLVGNSINVTVVTDLMKELLFGSEEDEEIPVEANEEFMTVGGTNGHLEETISGNILCLYQDYRWKMIPNCTGRYTCRDHKAVSILEPLALLKHRAGSERVRGTVESTGKTTSNDQGINGSSSRRKQQYTFNLPGRSDAVLVVPLDTNNRTGLITFVKKPVDVNGGDATASTSYVHTLNTPTGFRRKLEAIGIQVTDDDIFI